MRLTKHPSIHTLLFGGALCLAGALPGLAGTATYDFTQDPQLDPQLTVVQSANPEPWREQGGNPGGFLAITWAVGSQYTGVLFPDIDPGQIVTAFNFKCDLRIGNGSTDRPADGFSISFARDSDPLLADIANTAAFAGGLPEAGSTTGIAVSFDTWSGNVLPDGGDIEGIMVRVDNRTILRQALPTRHGACEDPQSLQTGPRDAAYWAEGGDAMAPEAYAGLCWQPFEIDLTNDGKLTVIFKGVKILDAFQTDYFPSAGRLILSGRTGGSNEATHVDNIRLTTIAVNSGGIPTTPSNFVSSQTGARRIALSWGASTVPDGSRVAYELTRNGDPVGGILTETSFEDIGLQPGTQYTYEVKARNLAGETSPAATVSATTVAEVAGVGFPLARVYDGLNGAGSFDLDAALASEKWPNDYDRGFYVNGLSFGEPAFGDTYGENHMVAISAVLTVPETGAYHFFVRSDDASRFFINRTGAAIPDPLADFPVAEETDCCDAFMEPESLNDDGSTSPTTLEPIQLTAGQRHGILFLVKEGGGGDWGQVAWRKVGDTTPAAQLQPIRGAILEVMGDPVGASVTITTQPANTSTPAYQSATFSVVANTASPYTAAVAYQWYRNNTLIAGATSSSYTLEAAQPADNDAKFKVLVAVPGASATSSEATLTVSDNTPATITSIDGSGSFTTATVTFNQPVAAPSATTAANYTFSGGLTVSAATQTAPDTIRLTTSQQTEGTAYTLTVQNVQNLGGKPVAAGTTGVLNSWVFQLGSALYEVYSGPGGVLVADLLADPNYPNSPSLTQIVPAYEAPIDRADNFGGRLSGWIVPTETASYVFFLSADDQAELYLSTDASPANAKKIAQEPTWNGARQWLVPSRRNADASLRENRSDTYADSEWTGGPGPIQLTAGQRYYTHILYKEGGGGDNAAATWKKVGDPDPADGSPALTAIGTFAPPTTAELEIDSVALQGGNVVITYSSGRLQSSDTVNGTYTDVAGATSPYSTQPSGTGKFYRLAQ